MEGRAGGEKLILNGWFFLAPDLFPLHVAVVFVFGATMGSFFNVCIYRLPLEQSINRPRRSFCPTCGATIGWYDNIPLASYLVLGGLCRHCGARISSRYFWVELLTALLFTGVFWVHRYSLATPVFMAFTAILIIATFTDIDHWIIPDSISLGGALLGVAVALVLSGAAATGRWEDLGRSLPVAPPFRKFGPYGLVASSAAGAAFGFLLLWIIGVVGTWIFKKEAMGMGDMKLFACVGAFLGWHGCLLVLVIASFLGATLGLALISAQWIVATVSRVVSRLSKRASSSSPSAPETARPAADERGEGGRRLHHLPFGPYIAAAGYVVALFIEPMTRWLATHVFFFDLFA